MPRRLLAALAAGILLLAGCGASHYDGGAISLPKSLPGSRAGGVTVDTTPGPATRNVELQGSDAPLSWLVEFPELKAGNHAGAINSSLRGLEQAEVDRWKATASGASTSLSCQTDLLLDSTQLYSVSTTCTSGSSVVAVVDGAWRQSSGARLRLSELLTGRYLRAMSAEAVRQLEIGGASAAAATRAAPATGAAFADWGIDPSAIDVVLALPSGARTVSFSLDGLAPYLRAGGLFRG